MPAFNFPIGSIVKCNMICQSSNQISVTSWKFQLQSLTGSSFFTSTAFLTQVAGDLSILIPPLLANDALFYGLMLYLENPIGPRPRPDTSGVLALNGTAGAGMLPTQTSGLISWYSDVLGKPGQGRSYIPFPAPASNDTNGTPTAAYGADLASLASYLANNIVIADPPATGTFNMVLYAGGISTAFLIDDGVPRDAWATQRRRGSYGKANSLPF